MNNQQPPPELRWEHNVALLTNRFILFDLFKIMGITYVLIVVLFSLLGLLSGEMELGWQMAQVFAVVVPAVTLGLMFIMLVFYVNRMPIRYTLNSKGVTSEILGKRSRWANRTGIVLGLLSGNPTVAGASLLAKSRETTFYRWRDLHKAAYYPAAHTITLFNGWRSVARLHCTPEHYPEVASTVRECLLTGAADRDKTNSKPARA
ncbi:MAG: hypothetical protein KJ914_08685 [Gammaproteobacteria bacterium]|nr:hypothetical protein [Gammaproteobacteria bacterium]MBU1723071.1 hypothetical protein [Gammaproteobacteria bacterium]MBU2004141.1 hypothetical protein [Gammaproteobacteria bacterium]